MTVCFLYTSIFVHNFHSPYIFERGYFMHSHVVVSVAMHQLMQLYRVMPTQQQGAGATVQPRTDSNDVKDGNIF